MEDKPKKTTHDRVILTEVVNLSKMSGRIHIPDNAEIHQKGKVFLLGPDCRQFSEGDEVVLERNCGTVVKIGEAEFTVVREGDIMFSL